MLKAQFEKAVTCLRWSETEATNSTEPDSTNNGEETSNNTQRYPRQDLFDQEENNFDFSFLRATHLPFNKRVYMPSYANERMEAKISHARVEIERLLSDHTETKNLKNANQVTPSGGIGLSRRLRRDALNKLPAEEHVG